MVPSMFVGVLAFACSGPYASYMELVGQVLWVTGAYHDTETQSTSDERNEGRVSIKKEDDKHDLIISV